LQFQVPADAAASPVQPLLRDVRGSYLRRDYIGSGVAEV